MRAVVQRVSSAKVTVDEKTIGSIGKGFLILVGIEADDGKEDAEWLAAKISSMRIFSDAEGKMNLDITEAGGSVLLVSQFTLHASYKKGNRPSFIRAARPEQAVPLYEYFISLFIAQHGADRVSTGEFGADMAVSLINDGPVTICLDTRNKE
ncbi:MAG: hypothetical protein RL226_1485 [Bacteroidota bacterium]|jgi:D-tyrosyl-tRNA(Tyr) deacylase